MPLFFVKHSLTEKSFAALHHSENYGYLLADLKSKDLDFVKWEELIKEYEWIEHF
jgi:hypothetical protein